MLYKYAFTTRKTLSFQTLHSYTCVPPIFPPLSDARSSQELAADIAAAQAAVVRAPDLTAEAPALQEEGLSHETKELIAQRVNAEVAAIRAQLEEAFKQKEEEMRAKIEGLQRAVAR
jgi:DNA repair photolyase